MKSPRYRRQGIQLSLALHGIVLALMLAGSLVQKLWNRNRQPERLVFVDFTVSVPPPPAPETAKSLQPAPPKPPAPDPDDIAVPAKKPEAQPPAEKPKPREIVKQTNRVVRKNAPLSKDKPLSEAEIRKLLAMGARIGETTSIPDDDQIALGAYYNHIHERMYAAWQQPAQLKNLPGLSAAATITVAPGGQISARRLTRGSGNDLMDDSVMQAVNAVRQLKPLPRDLRKPVDVEIVFEIAP